MHKLGSRLFFSSLVGYLAKPTFLRVTASHCHYMRSIYLMDIHTCVCISNMCVCERACAYVHPTYHFPCCRRALSCRKTPVVLKLGMEVKNMFVCFWVLLGLFEVFLFFLFVLFFFFGTVWSLMGASPPTPPQSGYSSDRRSILSSSTSNTRVAPPGIFGGAPRSPYPSSDGITSLRFSPSHIPSSPWSQPLMTWPVPREKTKGWFWGRLLSNSVPSSSFPV